MTCYNQAEFIEDALKSVRQQTERDFQLIVTDDGSSDSSVNIINEQLRTWLPNGELIATEQNVGIAATLNRVIPILHGAYVAVLNGDDWMEPERLERLADALECSDQRVGVVYSDLRLVDSSGEPTGEIDKPARIPSRPDGIYRRIVEAPMIGMGSIMFRREILDRIGRWDEDLVADDFDFLLRAARAGYWFEYVPGAFYNYRQHDASLKAMRGAELAVGRAQALCKQLDSGNDLKSLVLGRIGSIAIALHGAQFDRAVTRKYLLLVLLRARNRGVARALIENILHLSPGSLSPTHIRKRLRKRITRRG